MERVPRAAGELQAAQEPGVWQRRLPHPNPNTNADPDPDPNPNPHPNLNPHPHPNQAEEQRLRAAAAAAYQPPELSSGSRRLSERAQQRGGASPRGLLPHGGGAAERRASSGGASASFLQRVSASATSRASERSLGGNGPAALPSNEQEHCTFAPRITEDLSNESFVEVITDFADKSQRSQYFSVAFPAESRVENHEEQGPIDDVEDAGDQASMAAQLPCVRPKSA